MHARNPNLYKGIVFSLEGFCQITESILANVIAMSGGTIGSADSASKTHRRTWDEVQELEKKIVKGKNVWRKKLSPYIWICATLLMSLLLLTHSSYMFHCTRSCRHSCATFLQPSVTKMARSAGHGILDTLHGL